MFDHNGDSSETLSVIKELMEQLVGEMQPSKDDFEERLGRKKPDMVAIKVEGKMPEGMEGEMMPEEMGEEMMEEDCSPEEKLKKRLLKLRS